MFESKNFTPSRIAWIISVATTGFAGMSMVLLSVNYLLILIFTLTLLIANFAVAKLLINRFINRKIKLIYKFIHQTKASKREEFFKKSVLPKQTLDEVDEEVLQWADQRKAEMEMLERNEAFRKEFLQNLSHEFKTPVFAIQGYLETLIDGAADDPQVSRKFLNNAMKNADRLIHLISDLDEITRLESGQVKLNLTTFIIQELIMEVFDALSIKTKDKNTSCIIKKGCEVPLSVYADKEKIRQVLTNLIDNAIKYGKAEGKVEASVYNTDENTVLIEISDNGIGIGEEHLARVFERFYRTDYGRSRNIGGTGLGLAICKHIIEAHSQIIHVRSKTGIGTTFGFTLSTKTSS